MHEQAVVLVTLSLFLYFIQCSYTQCHQLSKNSALILLETLMKYQLNNHHTSFSTWTQITQPNVLEALLAGECATIIVLVTLTIWGAYWATYAVYRNQSDNTYMRVSEMFRAIRTAASVSDPQAGTDGEINDGFNCYNDTIDAPLIIQAGDILGACVFTPLNDIPHGVIRLPL